MGEFAALDNPSWSSLTGPHAAFAQRHGQVLRYPADVSPFLGLPPEPGPQAWADLADLAGPGAVVTVTDPAGVPGDWTVVSRLPGVQLVDDGVAGAEDPEAVVLTESDVPDMLALVERTRPGPFLPRTIEMGTYLGIRREGRLVAMAGERMHPPGWTEISAVCTAAECRGQGLGTRLVLAVVAGIRARGERPFLHAAASNTGAIRLYESLGFRLRAQPDFVSLRAPAVEVSAV